MNRKFWEFAKFSIWLGIKSSPRVFISPWVGAVQGMIKEKERIDAEIDAYVAREYKEELAQARATPLAHVVPAHPTPPPTETPRWWRPCCRQDSRTSGPQP